MPTTGRASERRARVVGGHPIQRLVVRRCAAHDFRRAEQQFSREDFLKRQRHHTRTGAVGADTTGNERAHSTARHTRERTNTYTRTVTLHYTNTTRPVTIIILLQLFYSCRVVRLSRRFKQF